MWLLIGLVWLLLPFLAIKTFFNVQGGNFAPQNKRSLKIPKITYTNKIGIKYSQKNWVQSSPPPLLHVPRLPPARIFLQPRNKASAFGGRGRAPSSARGRGDSFLCPSSQQSLPYSKLFWYDLNTDLWSLSVIIHACISFKNYHGNDHSEFRSKMLSFWLVV